MSYSDTDNISFPNVDIAVNISGLEVYPRNRTVGNEPILFDELIIEEDMFAESIFGSVAFFDTSANLLYANQIRVGELIRIKINGDYFNFDITDINVVSDLASKRLSAGPVLGSYTDSARPTKIVVRFASNSFLYGNFIEVSNTDFIGKIAGSGSSSNLPGIDLPDAGEPMDGFVDTIIASKLNKPLRFDATFNDIWFKHDPTFYPWSKVGSSLRVSQLMNYICEYACSANNPSAVNYFFWEDLYNWNFRSLSSVSTGGIEASYSLSLDENRKDAILSFEIINAVSPTKLFDAGAFFSEYVRVKPKWDDIYGPFKDTNVSLEKKLIQYAGGASNGIGSIPVVNLGAGGSPSTVRISDSNYGFYSNAYNSPYSPAWNYYSNYNSYTGDTTPTPEPDRMEKTYWRSQFDFCELPGSWLKKIYKRIKWPIAQRKQEYAEIKRLKTEWEVYKKSLCCIRSETDLSNIFYAVLTKAEKVYGTSGESTTDDIENDSGGIWAYEWVEVELWPREDAKSVLKNPEYKIIEFEDNAFPFVFIRPPGAAFGMAPPDPSFKDTRAYNLNEILNSRIPTDFEAFGSTGPFTLMMNPGITDALGLNTENIEKRKELLSYPSNFAMMPVGKFRILNEEPCPPDWNDTGDNTNSGTSEFYFGGRIVQMRKIDKTSLRGIKPTDTSIDTLYLFDVENVHDGICTDCGEEV